MTEPFLRFLWLISSPRTKLLELFFVHLRELQASERSESSRFSKTKEVKLPCFLPDPTGLRLSSSPELPAKSRGRRAREGTDAVLTNGTFSSPHTQSSCRRVAQRKLFCSRVVEACESMARRSLAIFIQPTESPWFKGGLVMIQSARTLWSNRQRRVSQEMVTTQCDKCGAEGAQGHTLNLHLRSKGRSARHCF